MSDDKKRVWIRCYRGSELILTLDVGAPIPLDGRAFQWPTRECLETQAKDALTRQRSAFPPYDGIRFEFDYES